MTKLQQLCVTSYTAMKVFRTYATRLNGRLGICKFKTKKIYNTIFLFVRLGREVNAFSLIHNFTQIFLKVP